MIERIIINLAEPGEKFQKFLEMNMARSTMRTIIQPSGIKMNGRICVFLWKQLSDNF